MYKKMYYRLFNVILDALKEDDIERIKDMLIKGQQSTEEMYISYSSDKIIELYKTT